MQHQRSIISLASATFFVLSACSAFGQHDYKVSRRHIRAGNYDKAIEVLQQRIAAFPNDSEWLYQLAIARANQQKLELAVEAFDKAMDLGVPHGRVAADVHELLRPVKDVKVVQQIVDSQRGVPVQGPMLGNVTDSRASIWLRTAQSATVHVSAQPAGGGETLLSDPVETSAEGDFVAVAQLNGLAPAGQYSYRVHIDGQPADLPYPTTLRTSPSRGQPTTLTIAFGGGAGYVTAHERMWDTIAGFKPHALLLLGDNMYSDDPESTSMQRFCYYRRQSPPAFRRLVATTVVYSIWDDHDFGTNDCVVGPEIDVPAWKRPVWTTFCQNWANPGYGGGQAQPGCWYDFHVADIHFIMLDGRYYRDLKGGTMLGPVQKAWLKETVRDSQATFKVIASPVPWDYRTKGNSRDTWNGFREERTELFDYLAEHEIAGVVLISADRHRSDAWKIDRANAYPLYEFNSSRLTNTHVHAVRKEAIFSYNEKQSFGLVEFDTTKDDPTVTYTVVSIDGEAVHRLSVKHSELQ